MIAIGDSLSDFARSDHEENGDDEDDEDSELGKLSEDDEPGWVLGTISKWVQQHMERYRQKQTKLNESIHPEWGDTPNYVCGRDASYGPTELMTPAVVNSQTNEIAAAPASTTFGELMESLDTGAGKLQVLQHTSRPGSGHMSIGSGKPHTTKCILSPSPNKELDLSAGKKTQPDEPITLYPCILPSKQIII